MTLLRLTLLRRLALTVCAVCALSLTGCLVGPDYAKPAVPLKDQWTDIAHPRLFGECADTAGWWNHFGDPDLNYLVNTAYEENLTLRQAGMRIEESRANLGVARGNLGPQQQDIYGNFTRSRISQNRQNIFPGQALSNQNISLGLEGAWELDFWGRFRRAIQAASGELDASVENYDDVLVILISDTANNYIDMRTFEQRVQLAQQNVEIQTGTFKLVQAKFDAGTVSVLDVAQAETQLAQTEALIPALETARRQASNRICVLMGQPSRDLGVELGITNKIPVPPPSVAVGVPADLLRQRPDIRRAERQLAAQSARIGVATSEFYPHFSVSGVIAYDAVNIGKLIQPESIGGSIAPQFRWNVLNWGRIRNGVLLQDATFQRLAYAYQNQMVVADQEVENAIIAYLQGHERVAALERAVKAAQLAVDKVTEQYRIGVTDFNRVFLLQAALVQQQDALASARGDVAKSLVALYRALGGGWEIRLGQDGEIARLPPPSPEALEKLKPKKFEAIAPGEKVGPGENEPSPDPQDKPAAPAAGR